jgi:hypothetical protein
MRRCALPVHAPREFSRHEPEKTVLYQVVSEHLHTFLESAEARAGEGRGLPRYVRNAFRNYLECGILAYGFTRLRCPDCGCDAVVAFSCKERGICPSCAARHMSETAAFLADRVFPRQPVRQWVFSIPRPVRYALARDAGLLGSAVRIFVGEVFRDLQRRAGCRRLREDACGAVTGVQRFGGALNLNIHFHILALDGVYRTDPATGAVGFRRLPPPSSDDLDQVLVRTRRRIRELLAKRGLACGSASGGGADVDDAPGDPSALEALQGASVQGLLGFSGTACKVHMSGELADAPDVPPEPPEKPFSRNSGDGYNIEAGRRIRAGDREGLERICRYIVRPPFCQERLRRLDDGRVVYQFRRPWPDGSTHLVLEPLEFLGKLAALIPPPRAHLLRYHGVLAPNARRRRAVVPPATHVAVAGSAAGLVNGHGVRLPDGSRVTGSAAGRVSVVGPGPGLETNDRDRARDQTGSLRLPPRPDRPPMTETATDPAAQARDRDPLRVASCPGAFVMETGLRHRWRQRMRRADLLKRTMGLDALACPRCGGRMEPIAEILEPGAVAKILRSMGLPDSPPSVSPARSPPQMDFDFVQ